MTRLSIIILNVLLFACSANHEKKEKATTSPDLTEQKRSIDDSIVTKEFFYKDLSNDFNIKVFFKGFVDSNGLSNSSIVRGMLMDKKTGIIFDSVSVISEFYYSDYFREDSNVMSYSTKVNVNRQIVDNYFGDIVIADLNFDNKDDIVIINDGGGNSGPLYSFFLQDNNKKFMLDNYLTDSVSFFPSLIDRKVRTLTTYGHAGACCAGEDVYYLNKSANEWIHKSHRILGSP